MRLLSLAALCFTLGGVCMKWSAGLTRMWPSLLMSLLFLTGAALQALAMRNEDMSASYISVLGLETVLALACGRLFLGEAISAVRLCGVALIASGVLLLHR
ncbi:MAG TPA: SMR family transporter [Bryobacteraceae bacterium]|nr:SMR family transporter [Bryobacteraceae bacterium]